MAESSIHQLLPVGWSERVEALFSPFVERGLSPARVIGASRGWCRLATTTGERSIPVAGAVVGDWVALDGDSIVEVLTRWSALGRLDPAGGRQVLAANLDLVLIAAPADRLSLARVERELVIAWDSGARPIVVLTKLDIAQPGAVAELVDRLGVAEVIATSALGGDGLEVLASLLVHPVTAALLGPSGAGKTTLINALLGEERLAVGTVRDEDHRGRHTTSSRQLVPLPSGGSLIDMPGLRSLATDASDDAIGAAFPEIEELATGCRFADCGHQVEPGCAVLAAAAEGKLDPKRLANYHKLMEESVFERRQIDAAARKELARLDKPTAKAQHRSNRERPQ